MNRLLYIAIFLVLIVAAAVAGWLGLGWVQQTRANLDLSAANTHIENANRLMADISVAQMSSETFSSLDKIAGAAAAVEAMSPLLDQAAVEVKGAQDDAGSAAEHPLLPDWYQKYLQKKEETASARSQQIAVLSGTATKLRELYAAGPAIFSATQEMDRLFGQFQVAMGIVQSNPREASATLNQIAQSFTQVQSQLGQANAQGSFEILPELSKIAADNAELSTLAARLADAAGAGDQATAQQIAIQLEQKLLTTSIGSNAIDPWWQSQIQPLQQQYTDLQAQEDALDRESAILFTQKDG